MKAASSVRTATYPTADPSPCGLRTGSSSAAIPMTGQREDELQRHAQHDLALVGRRLDVVVRGVE